MIDPNFIILYVDNPLSSAAFYADLLKKSPKETSPTFVLFALDSGIMLGLCSKHTVEPAAVITGGGGEIGFPVTDKETVDSTYADWTQRGIRVAQKPIDVHYAYTFVVLDPDGHRLRVFCAKQQ